MLAGVALLAAPEGEPGNGERHVRGQLSMAGRGRPARIIPPKTASSRRVVPLMPAVERALVDQLAAEQAAGRGRDGDLVFQIR